MCYAWPMLPFTKILCPTDFSAPSLRALGAAVELAQTFNAELLLQHVTDPVPTLPESGRVTPRESRVSFDVGAYTQMIHHSASRQLEQICGEHVPQDVRLRPVISSGQPAEQIVALVEEEGADLIVIATHGRTGVSRLIFGSVAEKVVRSAGCPVLTIRASEEEG